MLISRHLGRGTTYEVRANQLGGATGAGGGWPGQGGGGAGEAEPPRGTANPQRLDRPLARHDDKKKETQRLVFRLLHANRFTYRYEVKAEGREDFTRLYEVGVTKEGVAFAGKGDNNPECVVSGGLGTMAVSYKGKTYYV